MLPYQHRFLTILLAFAPVPAVAMPPPVPAAAQPAADVPQLPHEKYVLPSGLEVILHPDRTVPLVAVNVWYHVGSGDEVVGRSGFAHLFEHMMFQGAKHIGEDVHFDVLRKAGASSINGTTNTDRTNYFEVVPSHQMETALWLESDRMGWLLDMLTQKSLDNQREVVRNERRLRYDNVPYGNERFALSAALYPEGHPYRYMTIGLHEDLERASLPDVKEFFRRWYVPSNATLTLAGDFDPTEAKALVAKWFGTFPATPRPQRKVVPAPQVKATRVTVQDPFARLRRLHLAWHSPAMHQPGDAELDLLAHALGHHGTGRLYRKLVHEKQVAQAVAAMQQSQQMSSLFHVIVDLRPEADLAEVTALVEAELEAIRTAPLTARELAQAVTDIESGFIWGLEGLMARAETLQAYNHYLGAPDGIAKDLARYRTATPEGIRAVVGRVLANASRIDVVTEPAPKARPAAAPPPTAPPPAAPPSPAPAVPPAVPPAVLPAPGGAR